jgi:hypothetical protein
MSKLTKNVPSSTGKSEYNFPKTHSTKLDITNPNLLVYRHEALSFEVLGGINTESYQMLRVMVIVKYQRITLRDNVDLYNRHNLEAFMRKVAEQTKFTYKYVEEAFNGLTSELETYRLELTDKNKANATRTTVELSPAEQQQAETFLKQPDLLNKTNELIGITGILGNDKNRLILFLIYLSRKQETPLHAVIQSEYNYLQTRMGELIPDEDKIEISHISDNALFYFDEYELSNKLVMVEDTTTNKNKLRPLFDLQTKGFVTKTTIEKDELGKLRTVQRYVRGAICLSLSTRQEHAFTSNSVLSFVLSEDTSPQQDERIIQYQRKQSAGLVNRLNEQKAVKLIQNLQRAIQPIRVVNPFAEHIQLPTEMLHKQITNAHYLGFIETITLLHQYQRVQKTDELTGEMYIETTVEDIEQANELLADILVKKCDVLNQPTRIYFEKLKTYLASKIADEQTFTTNEVLLKLGIPKTTVKRYNAVLVASGLITCSNEGCTAYQLTQQNEYQQMKDSVLKSLNESIKAIQIGSPQSKVAQKANGLLNTLENKKQSKVAHKVEVGDSTPPMASAKNKQINSATHQINNAS